VGKVVVGSDLRCAELDALLSVEATGELITVADAEDAAVDVQVLRDVEVPPGVVLRLVFEDWELVALEEDALRDTGVLDARLNNVECVVLEVVEHGAVADTVVLVGVLDDGLLEESGELKNLNLS
jgi:hypothetical protein